MIVIGLMIKMPKIIILMITTTIISAAITMIMIMTMILMIKNSKKNNSNETTFVVEEAVLTSNQIHPVLPQRHLHSTQEGAGERSRKTHASSCG